MKVLLDESLPRRLKRELSGHEIVTVPEMGWAGRTNGELLELTSGKFDVFLTADQKIEHQQNLAKFEISVIVLAARTNRFADLKVLVPRILDLLNRGSLPRIVRLEESA